MTCRDETMEPCIEPSVQAYVRLIRSSEGLHAGISRGLAREGLSASQFSAMKVLRIHGKLAQRDIAKHILKSCGNITSLVDYLEQMDLVTRDRDTKDRRIVYVSLTKNGEALFDDLYPSHLKRIRKAMGSLSFAECEQLISLLQKVSPGCVEVACAPSATLAGAR